MLRLSIMFTRSLQSVLPVMLLAVLIGVSDAEAQQNGIRKAEGYSAHADRAGLLRWASRVQAEGDVKHIFLVHGEEEAMSAFASGLKEQGAADVQTPARGEKFEL